MLFYSILFYSILLLSRGSPWRQVSRRIPSLCWEEAPMAKFTSGERTQDRGNVFHSIKAYKTTLHVYYLCLIGTHEFCIRIYSTKRTCQRAFFKDDFGTESYQAKMFRNHNTANAKHWLPVFFQILFGHLVYIVLISTREKWIGRKNNIALFCGDTYSLYGRYFSN